MRRHPSTRRSRGPAQGKQLFNVDRLLKMASQRCSVRQARMVRPRPLVNYTLDTRSSLATCIASIATPPADTRRVPTTRLRRFLETGSTDADDSRRVCACTFYLVFKEPESSAPRQLFRRRENFTLRKPLRLVNPTRSCAVVVGASRFGVASPFPVFRAQRRLLSRALEGVTAAFATGKVTLGGE